MPVRGEISAEQARSVMPDGIPAWQDATVAQAAKAVWMYLARESSSLRQKDKATWTTRHKVRGWRRRTVNFRDVFALLWPALPSAVDGPEPQDAGDLAAWTWCWNVRSCLSDTGNVVRYDNPDDGWFVRGQWQVPGELSWHVPPEQAAPAPPEKPAPRLRPVPPVTPPPPLPDGIPDDLKIAGTPPAGSPDPILAPADTSELPQGQMVLVVVMPAVAEVWAEHERTGRGIKKRTLLKVRRDLLNDDWQVNGDTIRFDDDGYLIDGRNRCLAIAQAGVAVHTYVLAGLPAQVRETIDTGTNRLIGDVLRMQGEQYANSLGTLLRRVVMWERGMRPGVRVGGGAFGGAQSPTHREMLEALELHPELRDAATWAAAAYTDSSKLITPAVFGMGWYLLRRASALRCESVEPALEFLEKVARSMGLTESDKPIRAFQRRMLDARGIRGRENRQYVSESESLALLITAWNIWVSGDIHKPVTLPSGGLNSENFPEPR